MITKWKINPTKVNLFLDPAIALAFVVELEEHFTGIRIHELLGLAFGAAFIVHIVLHWRWIVGVTRHFFKRLFHESRLNYVLNIALFIDMLVATVTGILIAHARFGNRIGCADPHDHAAAAYPFQRNDAGHRCAARSDALEVDCDPYEEVPVLVQVARTQAA
ncbi:MAG: hypothetical protein IT324_31840 [Anaerolineae bacterium]|nr:hypothetical protein [Anaerolineae bacterium]